MHTPHDTPQVILERTLQAGEGRSEYIYRELKLIQSKVCMQSCAGPTDDRYVQDAIEQPDIARVPLSESA